MTAAAAPAVRALLVAFACALLLPLSAPAAPTRATTACWVTLLNDWYDGRIDNVYPIPCYRDAIKHLPKDVAEYSSARDDIERALQLAINYKKNPKKNPKPIVKSTAPRTLPRTALPGNNANPTALPKIIQNSSPGGATSFPLPLIILGGLAIFLLAAGAVGLIVRRMQGRGPGTP